MNIPQASSPDHRDASSASPPGPGVAARGRNSTRLLVTLMVIGTAIRISTYFYASPFNSDSANHVAHASYIRINHSIPRANIEENWQPPLYYIILALLQTISQRMQFLHLFSLACAIGTLWIGLLLVLRHELIRTREAKLCAAFLITMLPQFVMYGLYIDNDNLATLLGFLFFYLLVLKRYILCMINLALGLLTKGHFLVIAMVAIPYLFYVVGTTYKRAYLIIPLSLLMLAGGCYKYFQNYEIFHYPFVSNLAISTSFAREQQGTYRSFFEFWSFHPLRLTVEPTLSEATRHTATDIFYGSFWYQYGGELGSSNPQAIGHYMIVVGLPLFFVFVLGTLVFAMSFWTWGPEKFIAAVSFIGNVAMLIVAFFPSDVWSVMNARSLFPTLVGGFVLLDLGFMRLERINRRVLGRMVFFWLIAFVLGALSYLACDQVRHVGL